MKKFTTTLTLFALLLISQPALAQQVIEVQAGQDTALDAFEMAQPGDTLELVDCGDTYFISEEFEIQKPITIRGAAECGNDERPTVYNNGGESTKEIFQVFTDFTLRNVRVYGGPIPDSSLKYAIRVDSEEAQNYTLKVFDSHFQDVVSGSDGNVLRAYPGTYADSIIFRNVSMDNIGKQAIRIGLTIGYDFVPGISETEFAVGYFEATNVTISDVRNEGIGIWGGDEDYTTPGPEVVINHVTCDHCGYEGSRALYPWQVNNTTITNVLLTNSPGNEHVVMLYGPDAFMNYVDTFNVGGGFELNGGAQVGDEVYNLDPQYVAPEEDNFTLQEDSPVRDLASDGLALGDTRNAGQSLESAVEPVGGSIPERLALGQNLPNPFHLSTRIPFKLDQPGHATLRVFDVLGREVATVVDKRLAAGAYEATFDASALSSGIYFYVLNAGGQTATRRMAIVK